MIRYSALLVAFLIMAPMIEVLGQENALGFDAESWIVISERWMKSQPVIMVSMKDGSHISGQPIHAGIDTLYLLASTSLPLGPGWYAGIHAITYDQINKVLVQKGGNPVLRSRSSTGYIFPEENKYFTKGFQELRTAAVYRDSLVDATSMELAFPHSPVLRQVFPHKRFRLSVAGGFQGGSVTDDAREALLASSLPRPEHGYGGNTALEILDFSWRFRNRIIVGAQLMARNSSSTVYAYGQDVDFSNSYHYELYYFEHRVYAEYVFFPVNRYFTKRWEFTAGAGMLLGKPEWTFFYSHDEYSDPDNPVYGNETHRQSDRLLGFQVRTAFHYYLFPGFSLSAGLEGNYCSPWTIDQVEVPSNNPSVSLVLQEHTLNFSRVRFKLGVSFYL